MNQVNQKPNQIFSQGEIFSAHAKTIFNKTSAIQLRQLVDKSICSKALNYLVDNESDIIAKYSSDKKGLSVDEIDGRKYIKYFEYPLNESRELFGKFINSNIFEIATFFLGQKVYLNSLEIHSRCPLGSAIPPHQDNAYYGLINGSGLTFYIPINEEYASKGGLKYYINSSDIDFAHKPSEAKGFSLTISNPNVINFDTFEPNYRPGDCTIHHSRSLHFADPVPPSAERGFVVRLTLHGISEVKKEGHDLWYEKMIKLNRLKANP
ncbi:MULTISPECIES: hypothetical protein [Prochlorococcus]|uniref:hypothetical protein n=1 Tax=Prochlorococcus TaxID=1218 RepID=UPI0005338022|nr:MULTISPECIES: hypothetical protein [Prochlorococcus]KGG12103.1 hypothetical protein EV05_1306 [Prochlorococcus sp. MIT 0601]